jgi:hypothetical protein
MLGGKMPWYIKVKALSWDETQTTRSQLHANNLCIMKHFCSYSFLLIANFSTLGFAHVSLEPLPLRVFEGERRELRWRSECEDMSTFTSQLRAFVGQCWHVNADLMVSRSNTSPDPTQRQRSMDSHSDDF